MPEADRAVPAAAGPPDRGARGDRRSRGRHLRRRPPGRPAVVASAVAVAAAAWPLQTVAPATDIDAAWEAGLHMAFVHHLHHGSQVLFTHGPLGFLVSPALWYRWTALAAWLFLFAALTGLAWVLVHALSRWVPLVAAVVVALVATSRIDRPPPDVVALVMFLVAVVVVGDPSEGALSPTLWVAGVLITALETLVKFNDGIYCLAVLAVAAAALGRGWWPRMAAAGLSVAAAGAAVVAGWLATGQRLVDLPAWLRGSVALSDGYGAMAIQAPGRGIDYPIIGVWLVVVGAAVVLGWRGRRTGAQPGRGAWMALLGATGLALEVKHGLVRHNAHVLQLLLFMVTLPLVLRLAPRGRLVALAASVLALAGLVNARPLPLRVLANPVGRMVHAGSQLADIADAGRARAVQAAARARMVAALGVDGAVLEATRAGGVQVDPWDTEVVWAYGLRWSPVPVFQSYSAYTPSLDEQNAAALASPAAPDVIVRARKGDIDDRVIAYESPRTYLAELCRYRQVAIGPNWQALRRGADACGAEHPAGSVTVSSGAAVAVPRPSAPDRIVVARLHEPDSLSDDAVALVFKPLRTPTVRRDGGPPGRLVAANAAGPLLVSVPANAPIGPGADGRIDVTSFVLSGLRSPVRVDFSELRYDP